MTKLLNPYNNFRNLLFGWKQSMNICDQYIHSPWEDPLGKSTVIRRQLDNSEMK